MSSEAIRNFCIIAHIDHGKSTLADRLLQRCHAIDPRKFRDQVLDDMDLERERGITIKARSVTIEYERGDDRYQLNLIDTPGHVDFSYEVSRALEACEGAVLVVDAAQGVEAQTIANAYLAEEAQLAVVPVVNKIDVAAARPEGVAEEMMSTLGVDPDDIIFASAKTGEGVDEILDAIVSRIPPPQGQTGKPLRALVFDAAYDEYRGVIVHLRVVDGSIRVGDRIRFMQAGREHTTVEVGRFKPQMAPCRSLSAGQVGYLTGSIKTLADVHPGDTVTHADESVEPLPGYRHPVPVVFCSLYPAVTSAFQALRDALERLALNDSSFTFEPESSDALGFGFRCGFLGLLHMEIVQERLERESGIEVVQTAPSVTYEVLTRKGSTVRVDSPAKLPDPSMIEELREPIIRADIITPASTMGGLMALCEKNRGRYIRTEYISPERVLLVYDLPLAEVMYDFYDQLKSVTRGFGTMDYELLGFKKADLVKLDIFVGGRKVDALSIITHRTEAPRRGRSLVRRLRKEIPRHLFEVVIQAGIGSRIIARESIRPLSKNVTAKCYGGDVTRKRKLLEKQKEGKKRMKSVGRVEIPQEAFMSVLKGGEE